MAVAAETSKHLRMSKVPMGFHYIEGPTRGSNSGMAAAIVVRVSRHVWKVVEALLHILAICRARVKGTCHSHGAYFIKTSGEDLSTARVHNELTGCLVEQGACVDE